MSRKHSFTLTLSNNVTEKEGINYLIDHHRGFYKIDKNTKKELLDLLKIDHKYLQAFDLVYIEDNDVEFIDSNFLKTSFEDIILVELKTTKKHLPENPKGFFFGATENEFNFGEMLGSKFRFCFVCLNPQSPSFALLTVDELAARVRYKRIQYQINL